MMENPEFRRHVWLELSAHRLIAMPAMLGLVFLLAYASDGRSLPWVALLAFGLIAVLWGSKLSSESILDEFRHATWDAQRRTAMDPWQFTWGRLLGAPVFAWYGGAISLATFGATAPLSGFGHELWPFLLAAPALALFGHALGAMSALATPRRRQQSRSSFLIILVLLILLGLSGPQLGLLTDAGTVRWFGLEVARVKFAVLTAWMLAAWGVVGVWRMLAREMQERTLPTAWLGFAAWLTVYSAGLLPNTSEGVVTTLVATAFLVSLLMSVAVVWLEPQDFVTWQRIVLHGRAGHYRRFLQEIPCWLTTMVLALIAALAWVGRGGGPLADEIMTRGGWALALMVWLFALRDIAILHFFGMASKSGRAVATTLLYLMVLYLILPQLLTALGLPFLARLLLPDPFGQPLALLVALLNAVVALGLVGWRWQRCRSAP